MAVGTLQKARKEAAPFDDDFNDGNYTGWSVFGGTWSASSYYARNTSGGTDRLVKSFTEPDYAMSFSYYREDSSNEILLYFRAAGASGGTVRLDLTGTYARIVDSASSPTQLAYSSSHGSATGTWYDGYVEVDGANVKVMLAEQGEMLEQVFNVATATTTDTARLEIRSQNGAARFDNIRIIGDGLTQTTTFAVNNANEMTSMTDVNGTTTFAYDGWGRGLSKTRGAQSCTFEYRYGRALHEITSSFPDESNETIIHNGGGLPIERNSQAIERTRWGKNAEPTNVEDEFGNLIRTFTGKNAFIDGDPAASGSVHYYLRNQVDLPILIFDDAKDMVASALVFPEMEIESRGRFPNHPYTPDVDIYELKSNQSNRMMLGESALVDLAASTKANVDQFALGSRFAADNGKPESHGFKIVGCTGREANQCKAMCVVAGGRPKGCTAYGRWCRIIICDCEPPHKRPECPNTCEPTDWHIDYVPPSKKHGVCPGNHIHYFEENQDENCVCHRGSERTVCL